MILTMSQPETVKESESKAANNPKIYLRSEHGISRKEIDEDAMRIMYRLIQNGFKAYLVGGAVRDLLLKKKPKDYDIATDATPRKVKALFRNCRIIGRRFKLAHIFFHGNKIIEVATFRAPSDAIESPAELEESEQTSRLHESSFGDNNFGSEETDAYRRDLTINGLFYNPAKFSVIDYVGGFQDIKQKVAKIIGNPKERIEEDPVRIIRTLRHAVKADFKIDPQTLNAIRENIHLIENSPEARIFDELKKDLASGLTAKILQSFYEHGLLKHLMPDIEKQNLLVDGSPLVRALSFLDDLIQDGEQVSTTLMLALICLYSFDPVASKLAKNKICGLAAFSHPDEIYDHVKESFPNLAVPRKEKEKIRDLLDFALFVSKAIDTPEWRPKKIRAHYLFEDLHLLFHALAENSEGIEVSIKLDELAELDTSEIPGESLEDKPYRRKKRRSRRRKNG